MNASESLLEQLLARGDSLRVEQGRLAITAASGRPIPGEWLERNERRLLIEAASQANTLALEYLGYSVGNYGPHRSGGVTLQFQCLVSGKELYAIFNAETRRLRTTKHGSAGAPLPKGRFRVGKRSNFVRFWQSTGLPLRRLSDFHDYMGKLSELTFTGSITSGDKLSAATLQPLTLILTDSHPTSPRHSPDNYPTGFPDKQSRLMQQSRGFQTMRSAWRGDYGKAVLRECGNTGSITSPELQSDDEWWADYHRG